MLIALENFLPDNTYCMLTQKTILNTSYSKHIRDTWVHSIRHQAKNSHIKWIVRWWSWNISGFSPQFWRDLSQDHQLHLSCWSTLSIHMSVGDDLILVTKILWMAKEVPLVAAITSASLVLLHFCLLLSVSSSYFGSYNLKQYVTPEIQAAAGQTKSSSYH